MRAVVHDRYGPPEVLRIGEVARPVPKEDEVLVRVYASTVTRGDAMGVRSVQYRFTRLFTGVRRPRRTIFGTEFAGQVEAVGAVVSEFLVGDDVFGIKSGASAEYVTVPERGVIATKPDGLTYEEAAAIPDGSLLALTMLQPVEPLRGKSVLVYGAAGSIGTAAVQLLLHHFEADVTAVCDGKDVEFVRSLGAGRVLDRFREDFTKNGETYDVIFDAVGKLRSAAADAPSFAAASMSPLTSASCTTCRLQRSLRGSLEAGVRSSASANIARRTSASSRSSSTRGSTGP
jgi:NADPH:quinone reductase-like Zn-dependent oxidoreductase